MDSTVSRRARKRPNYCRKGDCFRKPSPTRTMLAFSDRSDVPIEPRTQRAVVSALSENEGKRARLLKNSLRFFPKHWEKVYEQWLANIQDWCISRQVWWGHRIPAWYRNQKSEVSGQKSEIYVGIEHHPIARTGSKIPTHSIPVVLIVAVGLRDDGSENAKEILPNQRARNRTGHHFLLGRANDHCRARVHAWKNKESRGQHSVRRRFFTGIIRRQAAAARCRSR